MSDNTTAGARLHQAREAGGLSARELDRLAGKSEGHAAIIEARGQNTLRTDTLRSYCTVLGVAVAWLAFGEGEEPTAESIRAAVEAARARAATPAAVEAPRDSHPGAP